MPTNMIDYWFPIGIYRNYYENHNAVNSAICDYANNFEKTTVPSEDTGDWWPYWSKMQNNIKDPFTLPIPNIQDLKKWIEKETNEFAKSFNSSQYYSIEESWLNVNHKGDFQEPHYHLGCDFSAIYYVSTPMNSGKLVFENPNLCLNQRPINTNEETDLNSTAAIYEPSEGNLIIFRSNLRHGVLPHRGNDPRISIAVNLIARE